MSPTVGQVTYILPIALWQDLIDFQCRCRMCNDMPSSPCQCVHTDAFCISLRKCFFSPLMPLLPMIIITGLLHTLSFAICWAAYHLLHLLALQQAKCFLALMSLCYWCHLILIFCLCLLARTNYIAVNTTASSCALPDEEAAFWQLWGMQGCI